MRERRAALQPRLGKPLRLNRVRVDRAEAKAVASELRSDVGAPVVQSSFDECHWPANDPLMQHVYILKSLVDPERHSCHLLTRRSPIAHGPDI
jgi:hypothetical protein